MTGLSNKWQFWVDRGGTFTDLVARAPDGKLVTGKYLSENPSQYKDAALYGIRQILGDVPLHEVESIKLGTTVATNALLERKGEPTCLVTTRGHADALVIGDQRRPELFALNIKPPTVLFENVIEVDERVSARGDVLQAPDLEAVKKDLEKVYKSGIRSVAIVFMHGYKFPGHEARVAALARKIGFADVVTSHETVPVMKFVPRGSTTVADAYLSPALRRYVESVESETRGIPLYFMQSNGGLAEAHHFRGKDALFSGPAGGIVGAVKTAAAEGLDRIISFDMGGTSTDVAHYDRTFERSPEEDLEGVKLKVPSLKIHTVAAGGGSICSFDQGRFQVGPQSAGADPGPACYRRNGPLTLTDCNLILGKLQPELFPHVFGKNNNQPLDLKAAEDAMAAVLGDIEAKTGKRLSATEAAEGFIAVAVEHMARAIKKISVQKGHDITRYALVAFGGAGGQHACQVADALGIETIIIHPLAGVLSALGIGESGLMRVEEKTLEKTLNDAGLKKAVEVKDALTKSVAAAMLEQGAGKKDITFAAAFHIKYQGSDTALPLKSASLASLKKEFTGAHETLFGFAEPGKDMVIQSVQLTGHTKSETADMPVAAGKGAKPIKTVTLNHKDAPIYKRDDLKPETTIKGPAIIIEDHGANIVEPGWHGHISGNANLVIERTEKRARKTLSSEAPDPIMLEIFNNRFMTIAEEMGAVLENTAHSVNIKERLDFSCALFDPEGDLVANAPHMPVHLGSMSESVKTIAVANAGTMKPGNAYLLNDPYHGGTHLPDLTVVVPVFLKRGAKAPDFFVASRGHHADIGGITPGSMPPKSKNIEEEGVLFTNFPLVQEGRFLEHDVRARLTGAKYPARNPDQNIADIKAMQAACQRGITSLVAMCAEFGLAAVLSYMRFIQKNAENAVRDVIDVLHDGEWTYAMDNGLEIKLAVRVNKNTRTAEIDFTGTSKQTDGNFNAPRAVTVAAVLYTFRCLVGQDIPLNAGCLKPLNLIVPEGCFLNPKYPAAVVAGNVETSQAVTNCLLLALDKLAASQGTMNNLTFGNDKYQYYETICGGSGAGDGFSGMSARQVHMTNSRLTDPEVLEWRYPVLVEEFAIRKDSGGTGQWRGGNGTVRKIKVLEDMEMSILSSHRVVPPPGLDGGKPGKPGENYIIRRDKTSTPLKGCATASLEAGDTILIKTPGGGGFGQQRV